MIDVRNTFAVWVLWICRFYTVRTKSISRGGESCQLELRETGGSIHFGLDLRAAREIACYSQVFALLSMGMLVVL
jgi:hypothetical protein